MRGIHRTRIVSVENDCCRSNGCHCEITRMCWTSHRRSISLLPGGNGGRSKVAQNSKVWMSIQKWIRFPPHKWPKSWLRIEDPVVPLERNSNGHPLAGHLWERQIEEVLLELRREKVPNWECLSVHRRQGLFLLVFVEDIKMSGKKQNFAPMWKNLMKHVDLDEQTSFLDHVYLGCTQRECKVNENVIDQIQRKCSNHELLQLLLKHYQDWRHLTQKRFRRPTTWKDMLKKCVERDCEPANKRQINCTKFQPLAWMITTSRRRSWKQSETCQKCALRLF